MEAVMTRRWVRDESLMRFYAGCMDTGEVPVEAVLRPAPADQSSEAPIAVQQAAGEAEPCLCGVCPDCVAGIKRVVEDAQAGRFDTN